MSDSFHEIETEFFKLRGLFATGNLSAEEFDAALQKLQVRDAKGRVWMLGANTGRWYHTPHPEWIEGDPNQDAESPAEDAPAIEMPRTSESAWHLNDTSESTLAPKLRAWTMIGIATALIIIAAIFFGALNVENFSFASAGGAPTATRLLPRPAVISVSSNPPTSTPRAQNDVSVFSVTPIPFAATLALVIEPTSTEPALTVIPTITPNPNKQKAANANPALPPAVYVTNIRVAPHPPGRRAAVTFTASFWNTNRESVPMNWRIILLDPNRGGRNKEYGESPFAGITVPPGRTEFAITYTPVNSGGPCVTLQALAARRRDDNSRVLLLGTNGNPFGANVTFC